MAIHETPISGADKVLTKHQLDKKHQVDMDKMTLSQLTRSLHVNKMKVIKYCLTTRTKTSRNDDIPAPLIHSNDVQCGQWDPHEFF